MKSAECNLSPTGLLIDDVKRVANSYVRLLYSHIKRNGNKVAHSLAKNALHIPDFHVWLKDVPSHIVLNKTKSASFSKKKRKKKKKKRREIK